MLFKFFKSLLGILHAVKIETKMASLIEKEMHILRIHTSYNHVVQIHTLGLEKMLDINANLTEGPLQFENQNGIARKSEIGMEMKRNGAKPELDTYSWCFQKELQ